MSNKTVLKRWPDPDDSRYLYYDTSHRSGRWYFWDETWSTLIGPFPTREIAVQELRKYADNLDRPKVQHKWNRTIEKDIPDGEVVIGRGPDPWPERFIVVLGCGYFTRPTVKDVDKNVLTPKPSEWRQLTEEERVKFQ